MSRSRKPQFALYPRKSTDTFLHHGGRNLDCFDATAQYCQRLMTVRHTTDRNNIYLALGGTKNRLGLRRPILNSSVVAQHDWNVSVK